MLTLRERGAVQPSDVTVHITVTEYDSLSPSHGVVTGGRTWILAAQSLDWDSIDKGIVRCTFVDDHQMTVVSSTEAMSPRIPGIGGAICEVTISVQYRRNEVLYPETRTERKNSWETIAVKLRGDVRDMNREAEMVIMGREDMNRLKRIMREKHINPDIKDCVHVYIHGERPKPDLSTCSATERQCALGEVPYKHPPPDYVIRDMVVNLDAKRLVRIHTRCAYQEKLATPIRIKNPTVSKDKLSAAARIGVRRGAPSRRCVA